MALSTGLVSYWSCDEASGNLIDAHSTNDLVETSGTIAAATGKINGGRDFELSDTEHALIASNSEVTTGDIDFSWAGWINPETATAGTMIAKFVGAGDTESEYMVDISSSRIRMAVRIAAGSSNVILVDANFGNLSAGNWYFFVGYHDSVNNVLGISVNDVLTTVGHTTGVRSGNSSLFFGARSAATNFLDGILDEVGFWKKVLSSSEITELYNAGAGRDYAYITGGAASSIKTINGLAKASIKTVNGLAIASMKARNGLA